MATQPSIEKLQALETGAVVTLRARVVGYHDGLTSLRDHSGSVEAQQEDVTPIGSWVELEGLWDGSIIRPTRWTVVQRPTGDFPALHGDWARLQDKQGLGIRRLQDRAKAMRATRSFFDAQDFCELETPSCVPSPGLDFHLDAFGMAGSPKERWLITSPEYQMKRALSAGLPRIFQLCHCFRRDESGIHHDPEFTMLEWYRSFAGSAEVMQDTEELVQHLAIALIGKTQLPKGLNVAAPWPRRRVEDVLREHTGLALSDFTDDDAFFQIWVEKVEPQLGLNTPVFITHWPARMASLARLIPDEPQYADRFEAYAHGLELCNGFGELVDAAEQRRRLENDRQARINAGRPAYPVDERFLLALEEGIPPSGGNALGFDRLLMLLLGAESIAEVMAFPESHR